ncbi:indole-3-glycerol phosphate synthase TrpC [Rubrivirga sp. S365]|uniref:Indole-3-glycerol phosphate synthase n=1 Tax=Rubrivirga litoralis TaxID=3075598 RepID=A0ABU3BRI4_9BACT|nr:MULTISPECIES: indole-3-glycerol phosphate synthase TrpC [unclassified Rubrivirga]MDT0631905.1 indole-3-glycerol phosphate synthase TrpC [Rubrivirga sp. F394]MDT7857958.1 indole-3-glycerol phosphate synthase TrpC [Rubrivirga sp. S365]
MSTILDQILADTRALVAERRAVTPAAALTKRPAFHAPTLSLARALRRPDGPAYVAECKRASPSEGVIRPEYDPAATARAYKQAAAAAISVLTEPTHFQGSLEHLAAVRHAVDLPVLRKDFVVDDYQLVEARAYGADAVLLIAAALDRALLHDLLDAARDLGLGVLVEVHDERELDAIDLDRVDVLGANSRDLKTFRVDLDRAGRVFAHLPARIVRVAESGIRTAEDAARLRASGADAFLVGTHLMRSADPGRALAALRRETAVALASGTGYAVRGTVPAP